MQHTRKRILCVDDHEDSCRMMKVLLEMWNYEVALAGTGADGLRLAQSEHFDLYLLDAWLPEVSGIELCEQICGVPGHAPVVFISGAAYESDKQRGLQAGAVAYLAKPLDFDVLEIMLARLLPQPLGNGQGKYVKDSRGVTAHAHLKLVRGNGSGAVRSRNKERQI
jgi:DNA-binding response OmpR family regulator